MINGLTIQIPVKPYLKQFLTAQFGSTLQLSDRETHIVGVYILLCLEGKRHTAYDNQKLQRSLEVYTEKYSVKLPPSRIYLQGCTVPPHNVIFLNRMLENHFDMQLFLHSEQNRLRQAGQRYFGHHESLRQFLQRYQIEEDVHITFEALAKRERRIKKKMEGTAKKNLNNSLQLLSAPVFSNRVAAVA